MSATVSSKVARALLAKESKATKAKELPVKASLEQQVKSKVQLVQLKQEQELQQAQP